MRVIYKAPGRAPRWMEIEDTLDALQGLVCGYIETVSLADDLVVICNEEGRLMHLPYNCCICGMTFVGPIILAGVDGDHFADAPEAAARFFGGEGARL